MKIFVDTTIGLKKRMEDFDSICILEVYNPLTSHPFSGVLNLCSEFFGASEKSGNYKNIIAL